MSTLIRPKSPGWRSARRAAAVALIAAFVFGCSSPYDYLYRPVENATAYTAGYPAAHYAIPPTAPRGDVRVASFGIIEIGHEDGPDLLSVQVRMVIANNAGERPWTIDTREVRIDLHNQPPRGPAFVNAGTSSVPVVIIPAGQQRTIDLFYPLPPGQDDPEDVPAFDVLWQLMTDADVFAARTPFERLRLERTPPPSLVFAYGPAWWYDPWYPGFTIIRPTALVNTRLPPPPRVHVHAPRR